MRFFTLFAVTLLLCSCQRHELWPETPDTHQAISSTFGESGYSPEDLPALDPDLENLHVSNIRDEDIGVLSRFTRLRGLWLDLVWMGSGPPRSGLTDKGLLELSGIQSLRVLVLDQQNMVTGEGVRLLKSLRNLQYLVLFYCGGTSTLPLGELMAENPRLWVRVYVTPEPPEPRTQENPELPKDR
jgi:hypothetical protein